MNLKAGPSEERPLPLLRDDISLSPGTPSFDGSPTWVMNDPIRGTYFQIGWPAYQLLTNWSAGTIEQCAAQVSRTTTYQATVVDVEQFVQFLYASHLTRDAIRDGYKHFAASAEDRKTHWLMWLIHHYLFFKIPLVRPDRWLRATLPWVEPLFRPAMGWCIGLAGLVGIYLVARQWEAFLGTFTHFFTMQGLALYLVSLAGVKVCHELGHAYTATRYGCRVPTMGIACMVMMPLLYSDTSDAWRLRSNRQRAMIGAAGMIVELSLAALATLAWNFLPDGIARSIAFVVATTSWVLGAIINLNPLMRFDGYYVLADALGIPNLQDRSFAVGQWRLRRLLFGLEQPPPEPLSESLRRFFIGYAWAVWVYRFVLFLGIALLVYHYFFKALGIILFAIEIGWFIILPIAREVGQWWKIRETIRQGTRGWVVAGGLVGLGALLFVPWSIRVHLPAVVEVTTHAELYAPVPAQVSSIMVREGDRVKAGVALFQVETPELEKHIQLTEKRIEVEQWRTQRAVATAEERAKNQVTLEALRSRLSELQGYQEQVQRLSVTAPFDGIVTDIAEGLHTQQWVKRDLRLAYLIDPRQEEIHALVQEVDVSRIEPGQTARFVPESLDRPSLEAVVQEVRALDESVFSVPYLASLYGGAIPVREGTDHKLKPESSVYRVTLRVVGPAPQWGQALRGTVVVSGARQSLAQLIWEQIVRVLIRESGL